MTHICCRSHESDTSALAHTGSLLAVVAPPRHRSASVSRQHGSPVATRSSTMKKAKSGRKNKSVTCRKSHAQICAAWLRRNVLHFCPRGWWVRTVLMYFWIVRLHTRMPSESAFTPDPFSTPEPIVPRHLSDQGDRFWGDLGLARSGLGLPFPVQAKELLMPASEGCLVAR